MVVFLVMSKVEKKMLFICICVVFSFYSLWQSLADDNPYKQYTNGLLVDGKKPIEWNSVEGRIRLTRTKYKKPFFALAHHFSGQEYPSTCGPASARIVLSAIYEKIGRPFRKDEQHSFTEKKNGIDRDVLKMTERNVFDLYNEDIITYDIVARLKERKGVGYDGGIDLNQLADVIASHPNVIVDYNYLFKRSGNDDKKTIFNNFRKTIKYICSTDDIYMIVLYNLTLSYDKQSGHYSPLVAYDEKTDSVLIMDVASHLGTWIWVSLEDLFVNMNPTISGTDRGYIVVKQTLLSEEEKLKQMEAIRAEEEKRIMEEEDEEISSLEKIEKEGKKNVKNTQPNSFDKKDEVVENVIKNKESVKYESDKKNENIIKNESTDKTLVSVNTKAVEKTKNEAIKNKDNDTQKVDNTNRAVELIPIKKNDESSNSQNKKQNDALKIEKAVKRYEKSFSKRIVKVKKPSKKEYNKQEKRNRKIAK